MACAGPTVCRTSGAWCRQAPSVRVSHQRWMRTDRGRVGGAWTRAHETPKSSVIEPLREVSISVDLVSLPKADVHVHANAEARLERVLARREGWPAGQLTVHAQTPRFSL